MLVGINLIKADGTDFSDDELLEMHLELGGLISDFFDWVAESVDADTYGRMSTNLPTQLVEEQLVDGDSDFRFATVSTN